MRTLMIRHITMLLISMMGALTAIRIIIWNAFCRLVTSVVMRVTRPAVLNLSMFENENCWILLNIASRRLHAKPAEAFAANFPASTPKARLMNAIIIITRL